MEESGFDLRVPLGQRLELPGRGRTFVRQAGAPGAPAVLLVHGWMASAGLNWAAAFEPLAEHFHVVAPDLRGHGRGIRSQQRFRLEDCADDLAALIEHFACGPVIVVGYSMGGLVAQLLWHRRPDLVAGLVLCSTTRIFVAGRRERYLIGTTTNYIAAAVRASRLTTDWYRTVGRSTVPVRHGRRPESMRRWATAEMRRHDVRQLLEAAHATSRFDSRPWIGAVDVPAAVLVTTRDRAVAPKAQRKLASAIAGASVYEIDDDHTACGHAGFPPVLVAACRDVAGRAGLSSTEERPPARR